MPSERQRPCDCSVTTKTLLERNGDAENALAKSDKTNENPNPPPYERNLFQPMMQCWIREVYVEIYDGYIYV